MKCQDVLCYQCKTVINILDSLPSSQSLLRGSSLTFDCTTLPIWKRSCFPHGIDPFEKGGMYDYQKLEERKKKTISCTVYVRSFRYIRDFFFLWVFAFCRHLQN